MPSIAIIGAGPDMGLAIARTFGSRGFEVALISMDRVELDDLVGRLTAEDITAAAFCADVLDPVALTRALEDAATRFGGIDVLEYSGSGTPEPAVSTTPSEADPSPVRYGRQSRVHGAITATNAVLPAMRRAGSGTLLYTTRTGSPCPVTENAGTAAAGLRDWVTNLREELAGTGVQAAHVALDVTIGGSTFYGQPRAIPDQIAPVYWDLHTRRDEAERVFRG